MELDVRAFTHNIFTCENMLTAVAYDRLYIWPWADLNTEPQKTEFDDSWLALIFSRAGLQHMNYNYSLISPGRLVCALHQRNDTFILVRSIAGDHEFERWSLGRRWDCFQLRNSRNGKYVAVRLHENYRLVLRDEARSDDGRHRLGILRAGSDEIEWVSTIYRHSVTLPNISSIAVSEDGKYLAAVGTNNGGFIHLADVARKKMLWEKVPHGEEVPHGIWTVNFNDVCFSPDANHIYVAGNCGLFCFDTATGKILSQWQTGGRLVSVAVSPDGRLVAGGTEISGLVYIYERATAKLLLQIVTNQGSPYRLAFSPDSTLLATSGTRRTNIKIWEMPPADSKSAEPPQSVNAE